MAQVAAGSRGRVCSGSGSHLGACSRLVRQTCNSQPASQGRSSQWCGTTHTMSCCNTCRCPNCALGHVPPKAPSGALRCPEPCNPACLQPRPAMRSAPASRTGAGAAAAAAAAAAHHNRRAKNKNRSLSRLVSSEWDGARGPETSTCRCPLSGLSTAFRSAAPYRLKNILYERCCVRAQTRAVWADSGSAAAQPRLAAEVERDDWVDSRQMCMSIYRQGTYCSAHSRAAAAAR